MKLDRIPKNLSLNLNKISIHLNNYLCRGAYFGK
jgi:hypothetical protein